MKSFAVIAVLIGLFFVSGICASSSIGQESSAQPGEKVYQPSEVSRKARITLKPPAQYTEEARKRDIRGRVILRVVLRASGDITDIEVIKGLPYGLTEECIKVAHRIKFEPAVKDGQKVSQYVDAQYVFIGTGD